MQLHIDFHMQLLIKFHMQLHIHFHMQLHIVGLKTRKWLVKRLSGWNAKMEALDPSRSEILRSHVEFMPL